MPQILITGMHRSGTTLLSDLVGRHPSVQSIFNEAVLIDQESGELVKRFHDHRLLQTAGTVTRSRNVERFKREFPFDPFSTTWLNKISYPGPVLLQDWRGRMREYCERWLTLFGSDARIINIIRHPFAVYCSARRRWASDAGYLANYGVLTLDAVCKDWTHSVEALDALLEDEPRGLTLRFEDLVRDPEELLRRMYEHAGLPRARQLATEVVGAKDIVFFGHVDATRADAYCDDHLEPIAMATRVLLERTLANWEYAE